MIDCPFCEHKSMYTFNKEEHKEELLQQHLIDRHRAIWTRLRGAYCPVCQNGIFTWQDTIAHFNNSPDCVEIILVDTLLESL